MATRKNTNTKTPKWLVILGQYESYFLNTDKELDEMREFLEESGYEGGEKIYRLDKATKFTYKRPVRAGVLAEAK
jgi:hypothetical protein